MRSKPVIKDLEEHSSRLDTGIFFCTDCTLHVRIRYEDNDPNNSNFNKKISEELDKQIHAYNASLQGIFLGRKNLRVKLPIEANKSRQIIVTCIADVFLFKPIIGAVLTGILKQKSKNHLGLLVNGIFNASILKTSETPSVWKEISYKEGDEIQFTVLEVNLEAAVPYIYGDFVKYLLLFLKFESVSCHTKQEPKCQIEFDICLIRKRTDLSIGERIKQNGSFGL